jgi:hypothetical protein
VLIHELAHGYSAVLSEGLEPSRLKAARFKGASSTIPQESVAPFHLRSGDSYPQPRSAATVHGIPTSMSVTREQSDRRESNPLVHAGNVVPEPFGHDRIVFHLLRRDSNPQHGLTRAPGFLPGAYIHPASVRLLNGADGGDRTHVGLFTEEGPGL